YPGMPNTWWMPIQTRNEMLATGVRAQVGVKVYGPDLDTIERASIEIERALADVPGTRSAYAERLTGGFYLDVEPLREEIARLGLRVRDVNQAVEVAIGGATVTSTIEGRARHPVQVRYARDFREDPAALERVLVATPSGGQVPLGQIARITPRTGPDMVRSEAGQLAGLVQVSVGDRPIVDYVADARRAVAERVQLPPGVHLEWAGQFRAWERARDRLFVLVPLTLLLVALLLYANTGSVVETGIVLLAVPFSLVGAVW